MGVVKQVVKHSLLRTLSVVCTLLVIGGLIWAIYLAFIKPHYKPTPTQRADTIQNYTYNYPEKKGLIDLDLLWGWLRLSLGPPKENKK
jgi:hypothetical protein